MIKKPKDNSKKKKTEFSRTTPNPEKPLYQAVTEEKEKSELTRNLSSPVQSKLKKD